MILTTWNVYRNPQRERAALIDFRDQELRCLVGSAYGQVPFYRNWFDAAGVLPGDIRRAEDLVALPLLSKSDLKNAPLESRLARGSDPRSWFSTTHPALRASRSRSTAGTRKKTSCNCFGCAQPGNTVCGSAIGESISRARRAVGPRARYAMPRRRCASHKLSLSAPLIPVGHTPLKERLVMMVGHGSETS